MRLIYKFFLAFSISSLISVSLMLALIMNNLSSGFHDFINEAELTYVNEINQKLGNFYQKHGSWQILKQDEQQWKQLIGASKTAVKSTLTKTGINRLLQTQRRLSLYNTQKEAVFGLTNIEDNRYTQAIKVNGQLVGWLSFIPSQLAEQSPANEFLAQQYLSYSLITLAVFCIAFITAWYFSHHLVAPITELNDSTDQLIRGNYKINVVTQNRDELSQLAGNMNILANTLDKSRDQRSKWMTDVAHELKTPLTVVRGQLMAIQDGIFTADTQRIQIMLDQIDSMSHLVGDIYQLSITDIGGLSYRKSPLNPIPLLIDIAHGFSLKASEKDLKLDLTQLQTDKLMKHYLLMADKERLTQLFTNLLENACRYTNAPGQIQLSATHETDKQERLSIVIADSSPSIPASDYQKVFERFHRLEPSRNREFGGSGIGLALCQQIVEAHQGSIRAGQSELGGVQMTISLPLYKGGNNNE